MSDGILDRMVEAIHQRHGFDVVALDMSSVPLTMEVFLLCTAANRIQARAIADHVERTARETGMRPHHVEGYDDGSWILIDFVDLVIHVFLPETRRYYGLEMLWSDLPRIVFEDAGPGGQPEDGAAPPEGTDDGR